MTATAINPKSDETPVIEVRNLVKEYRLGAIEGLRTLGRRMLGRPIEQRQRFRALDDITFTVKRGEVVGIIGHNGAGKSTLLKHLCRITKPTSGAVAVRGSVAPLIEVGAGLIGDMTGRENIYLNAAILGIPKTEISQKTEEIIAFSETERFIDTPLKRYSSGMQVRLAFAIALATDADILLVDEVLAVGDLAFQRKCYDRIAALLNDPNKTIIVVSHNIRQIERLCTRALYLDHGKLIDDDRVAIVTRRYYADTDKKIAHTPSQSETTRLISTGELTLDSAELINQNGERETVIPIHGEAHFRIIFNVIKPIKDIDLAVTIHTVDMLMIATQSIRPDGLLTLLPGRYTLHCRFADVPLIPGQYAFRVVFQDQLGTNLFAADSLSHFVVNEGTYKRTALSMSSLVHLPSTWHLDTESSDQKAENLTPESAAHTTATHLLQRS